MKIVILAAGAGTRLLPYTADVPKAMVEVDGKPIISHTIDALLGAGRELSIVVVGGYLVEVLRGYLSRRYGDGIAVVENAGYATQGPIFSVGHGLRGASQATMIMNGDTWFHPGVIGGMLEKLAVEDRATLFGSHACAFVNDDMKVCLASADTVAKVSKNLEGASALSAGVFCVSSATTLERLRRFLAEIERGEREEIRTWHEALNYLIDLGDTIRFAAIPRTAWHEIDTQQDLERIHHQLRQMNRPPVDA